MQCAKSLIMGAIATVIFLIPGGVFAHSGGTDSMGGHYNRKTGGYHYHNSGRVGSVLTPSYGDVWVNGYFRKDGTYVSGHWRTRPDGNPYNNYSTPRGLVIPNIAETILKASRQQRSKSGGALAAEIIRSYSVQGRTSHPKRVKSPPKPKLSPHKRRVRFLKIGGVILFGLCAIMALDGN